MWNRQRQAEKAREELAVALEQEQRLEGQKITDGHIRVDDTVSPVTVEASERMLD